MNNCSQLQLANKDDEKWLHAWFGKKVFELQEIQFWGLSKIYFTVFNSMVKSEGVP